MRLKGLLSRPFDRVRITPLGRYFSLFTLLFGIAAINSGNNLLYMILAYLLIMFFASGVLSTFNILFLELKQAGYGVLYKNRDGEIFFNLRRTRFCAFLLYVCYEKSCSFVPYIGKNGKLVKLKYRGSKRGIENLKPVFIYSFYPFGFAKRGIYMNTGGQVLVFPDIGKKVSDEELKGLVLSGEEYSEDKGFEGDFRGLKRYRTGENVFHIHWKKSFGELSIKEFEKERSRTKFIIISEHPKEDEIDRVASVVDRVIKESGVIGIIQRKKVVIPPGKGEKHEYEIMKYLALL